MSKRRSFSWSLALVLPAALALFITPVRAETPTEMSGIEPVTEVPVEVAASDGGADTGGSDAGSADSGSTTDGSRDTPLTADAAPGSDARSDGGTSPADDEGDCGCRLGGTGRSSAALPLAGALAGIGFIVRRRRRR